MRLAAGYEIFLPTSLFLLSLFLLSLLLSLSPLPHDSVLSSPLVPGLVLYFFPPMLPPPCQMKSEAQRALAQHSSSQTREDVRSALCLLK